MSYQLQSLFRIFLLGDSMSGKTCILLRYIFNTYHPSQPCNLGVDLKIKNVTINNQSIKVIIFDGPSQERHQKLNDIYLKKLSEGVCIIFDVTRAIQDFQNVNKSIQYSIHRVKLQCGSIPKILIANRIDLIQNDKNMKQGLMTLKIKLKDLQIKHKCSIFFTSAKTGQGIDESFNFLSNQIYLDKKGIQKYEIKQCNLKINEQQLMESEWHENQQSAEKKIKKQQQKRKKCLLF